MVGTCHSISRKSCVVLVHTSGLWSHKEKKEKREKGEERENEEERREEREGKNL
jgi:hypothetical protein